MTRNRAINLFPGMHVSIKGESGVWCVINRENPYLADRRYCVLHFDLCREGDNQMIHAVEYTRIGVMVPTAWDERGLVDARTNSVIVTRDEYEANNG